MKRLSLGLALSLLLVGCGGSGNSNPDPSTAQIQAGLHDFAVSVDNAAGVFNPLTYMGVPVGTQNGFPSVTKAINGGTFTVNIDYGSQPFDPGNGITRQGVIIITFDSVLNTGSVTFQNYFIGGQQVSGTINLSNIVLNGNDVSLDAVFDITVGTDEYKGTSSFSFVSGVYTITGTFTAIHGSITYTGSADHLVIDPGANGNAVPDSGSITFSLPYTFTGGSGTATVKVTFDANSPTMGMANVSINGGSPVSLRWKPIPTPTPAR